MLLNPARIRTPLTRYVYPLEEVLSSGLREFYLPGFNRKVNVKVKGKILMHGAHVSRENDGDLQVETF